MLKDLKLQIVYKPINSVLGYVNNARVHPQEQIDQIKSSIIEFGMCTPIGIHNDTIVYGHGRHEALKQLGYDEIPTLDLSHLTEAQRKAFTIADNKIGDNSSFDEELLKIELQSLQDNLLIGLYFTIISLIRSYLVRRYFNKRIDNDK